MSVFALGNDGISLVISVWNTLALKRNHNDARYVCTVHIAEKFLILSFDKITIFVIVIQQCTINIQIHVISIFGSSIKCVYLHAFLN